MDQVRERYDVLVVGAGPSGSSLAIRCALAGVKVLLIDKARFPRPKLCGEYVSAECAALLAEIGVADSASRSGAVPIEKTVFYSEKGKSLEMPSRWFGASRASAIGISRERLDKILLDRAESVGVDVLEDAEFESFNRHRSEAWFNRDESLQPVHCRVVIDATGRQRSVVRKTAGPERMGRSRFVAFKAHLRDAGVDEHTCEIFSYRGGYGGCSPVEDDRFNLCFIADAARVKAAGGGAEQAFRSIVLENRRAREVLARSEIVSTWLAVPITRFGLRDVMPADGIMAVGDAAGFIDPFTGSGILMALESAKLAAEVLVPFVHREGSYGELRESYVRAYGKRFDRRLRFASVLRAAAYSPMLAEVVVALLGRSPALSRRIALATRA